MSSGGLEDDDMPEEVDFSDAEQGKFFLEYMRDKHFAVIDEELAPFFPTAASVNEALKFLVRMAGANQDQFAKVVQAQQSDAA